MMDYFVDSLEGDDKNDGVSVDRPWRTIKKVNNFFSQDQSGNRIRFRSGRGWKEQLDFNDNYIFGSEGSPFVITSYGGGNQPSISGADRVSDWSHYADDIWVKTGFTDIQEVYYRGNRLKRILSLAALASGSSYYDKSSESIYIWLHDAANPNLKKVEVTARDYGIRLNAKNGYVTIENIYATRHRHDAISVYTNSSKETTDILIQRCHAAFAGIDADYSIDSSDGIVVYGQSADNRMRNLKIINNYSHHNLNCAVEVGKQDGAYIAGNRFEYCSNGLELWRASSNCIYERNAVAHMNNEKQVNRNHKEVGAWIHEFEGEDSGDNIFRQNVFLNCKKGIQIWQGSALITQNSFIDIRLSSIDIKNTDGSQILVDHNMMVVNRNDGKNGGLFVSARSVINFVGDYNSYYSSNPTSKVFFQIGDTKLNIDQWKLDSGQDNHSFQVNAVLPSDAPIDDVVSDSAWWVVNASA